MEAEMRTRELVRDFCKLAQDDWVSSPKPSIVDFGAGETAVPSEWLQAVRLRTSAPRHLCLYACRSEDGTKRPLGCARSSARARTTPEPLLDMGNNLSLETSSISFSVTDARQGHAL